MAHLNQRRPQNISGDFYVDSTCIDCDTCRWMSPNVFERRDQQSAVYHQPTDQTERLGAMQALLSCPTASIGTVEKPQDIRDIQQSFPILVAENVYHCGYHAENSYGAASYLIVRSSGNILVDSPRFAPPLVKRLEALGEIRYMYLTHKDDVADHAKFHQHFHCDRILHQDDLNDQTRDVEIQLSGEEPVELDQDLLIIPVPGHTKGHTVLLYQNKFLFTGDHLAWSGVNHPDLKQLIAFPRVCWYSWTAQIKSMQKLASYSFEWVLPGHGRRYHSDRETMKAQMEKCITWMESIS